MATHLTRLGKQYSKKKILYFSFAERPIWNSRPKETLRSRCMSQRVLPVREIVSMSLQSHKNMENTLFVDVKMPMCQMEFTS